MLNLKGYRVMAGYKQEDIADLLGISRVMYCYCENKKRRFSSQQKELILNLLKKKIPGLTMEDVFPIEE